MKKLLVLVVMLIVMAPAMSARADAPVFTAGPPILPDDPVASAEEAAWKAAHDTDPHLPPTAEQEQMLALKQQAVATYFSLVSGQTVSITSTARPESAVVNVTTAALAAAPASASVAANQQAQQMSYWCGPAAVAEALGQLGISMSQTAAAKKLGTNGGGTPWTGGSTATGRPCPTC